MQGGNRSREGGSMSKTLKPCPFCGGEAELCYGPGLGTDSCRGYTLYASCNDCGAKSPGLWQEKKPEPNDQLWKDAADEWNQRPGEEELIEQLADARADARDRDNALAAIMAVLPDSAKPCDAPDLIKHFKSQISAFGSEYIKIEKQLKEARAEVEHWKSECNALQRMVHEARAEIEHCKKVAAALNDEIRLQRSYVTGRDATIESKDVLIEQMRRAIEKVAANFRVNLRDLTEFEEEQVRILEAALEAAERIMK